MIPDNLPADPTLPVARPIEPIEPTTAVVPPPPPPAPAMEAPPAGSVVLDPGFGEFTGELETLRALAEMEPEAFTALPPARPIDLPAECRSGLLQLLESRSQLWARHDRMSEELEKFRRLLSKTAGRGLTGVEIQPLTTGDAEAEALATSAEIDAQITRVQTVAGEVEQQQLALVSKRHVTGTKRRKKTINVLRRELDGHRQRLRSMIDHGITVATDAEVRLGELIEANATTIREVEHNVARPEHAAWEMSRWLGWEPSPERPAGDIRLGAFTEERTGVTLAVPCVTPLIGSGRSLVIESDGEAERAAATSLLQSIVVRAAVSFPQQAHFTLLDPSGNGAAFPMTRHLQHAVLAAGDARRRLDDVSTHVQRIVSTYLDAKNTSFEELPEEMRLGENYHFVVAADFPRAYDLRTAEALRHLARSGPRAGVYVIVHVNGDALRSAPSEFGHFELDDALVVDVGAQQIQIGQAHGTIAFDEAPAAAIQEAVLHRVAALPPRDRAIPWDELNRIKEDAWWQESADHLISGPIGRHGAGEVLDIWFGHNERQLRSCVHGVLGAMPGAGKSSLLHSLICSLAIRYSPDELQLYLVDGKYGVEFRPYRNLAHARVVSLRTSPTMARSVLDDLVAEMAHRNAVFVEHGVVDLPGYRAIGSPAGPMPRLLLLVDEYQYLFDGDREGGASAALLRLSQQGRSAGVHFLLSSQRFDSSAMLHRNEIFGNVHLRLGMQLAQSEAAALTDFGVTGRRLIGSHCDRAGRIVVNDRAGDDDANVAAKAALLSPERRDQLVAALNRKAQRDLGRLPEPIVIDGSALPSLADNPQVARLVEFERTPTADQLAAFARTPQTDGGLGERDWLAAEHPFVAPLGKELSVRRHTAVTLRRRARENLLIVGDQAEARLGMLATTMLGAALTVDPAHLELWVADHGLDSSAHADVLSDVLQRLGMSGVAVRADRQLDGSGLIRDALALLEERRVLDDAAVRRRSTVVLVLHEPERLTSLRPTVDEFGIVDSDVPHALRLVLANGPALGVHVVMSTESLSSFRAVLSDRSLAEFRHRAVLQVPEEDSFILVRSTAASTLGDEGDEVHAAVRYDSHRQITERFLPYSIGSDGLLDHSAKLVEQIAVIAERLAGRHP